MNIVLDTNSLIMSIAPRSPYRKVWNAFLRGDYKLCVSNEINNRGVFRGFIS